LHDQIMEEHTQLIDQDSHHTHLYKMGRGTVRTWLSETLLSH